jgi:hypothetical protein
LVPAFGDIYASGVPSMIVGISSATTLKKSQLVLYRNEGSMLEPLYSVVTENEIFPLDIPQGFGQSPALADIDGDGLLDLAVGYCSGDSDFSKPIVYRNYGTLQSPAYARYVTIDIFKHDFPFSSLGCFQTSHWGTLCGWAPAFADLDGDGDLDLALGALDGGIAIIQNEGTPKSPSYARIWMGLVPDDQPTSGKCFFPPKLIRL